MKQLLTLMKMIEEKNNINQRRRRYHSRNRNITWCKTGDPKDWSKKYEEMKELGKTYTPRLRKLAKAVNARMKWDSNGYCCMLCVHHNDALVQYNREDMRRMIEDAEIENMLLGTGG